MSTALEAANARCLSLEAEVDRLTKERNEAVAGSTMRENTIRLLKAETAKDVAALAAMRPVVEAAKAWRVCDKAYGTAVRHDSFGVDAPLADAVDALAKLEDGK